MSSSCQWMLDESQVIAAVTRASYFEFLKEFWEIFVPEAPVWNWHIEFLCNELQQIAERVFLGLPKLYDLVINVPPGSTKSSAASVAFLPWCWTRMPSMRVLNGSHTHELVLDLSRKSREIVLSEKYRKCFPEIQLRDDQNTKGHFANTRGGARLSCTVGGKSPTGFHAHIHVVDDPIDPQRAISDIEAEAANTWMIETLSTRKVDKAVTPLILIMQRLTQNDPAGYILKRAREGTAKIRHICLPAELTEEVNPPEAADYYKDGLLDPVRLPRSVLEENRQHGDFFYSGQFLQNPIPLGGGMFHVDRLKFAESIPEWYHFKMVVRYWDNAGSPKGKGLRVDRRRAYSVGVLMGLHRDKSFWVLDVKRGRFATDKRENLKLHTAKQDASLFPGIMRIVQEQEGGSGGQESAENTARNLAGFKVMLDHPRGDKTLRADPFSTQVNIGNVVLVRAPWNTEYIEEMKHFPFSTYRDQIDASSGAFNTIFKLRRRIGAY